MRVLEMTVEMQGDSEVLINGENWQSSRSKAVVNEELVARMSMDQQHALLSMLQQAVMRVAWVHKVARARAMGVAPDELTRMERMKRSLGRSESGPKSKVIIAEG